MNLDDLLQVVFETTNRLAEYEVMLLENPDLEPLERR
jgi:hypothetical protein